jgi:hypothetical protein
MDMVYVSQNGEDAAPCYRFYYRVADLSGAEPVLINAYSNQIIE